MKMRIGVWALCLSAVSSAFAVGPSPTPAAGQVFLRALYAKYTPVGKPTPFVYPDAKNIVDPDLLALLKRDRDKSKGEVGAMDSDPLCRCQDWNRIKVTSMRIAMTGDKTALADVMISDNGEEQKLKISLVWVKDDWRIHDIGTKDEPSLITYLKTYKY